VDRRRSGASKFTLTEAVETFGLTYITVVSQSSEKHYWRIHDLLLYYWVKLLCNLVERVVMADAVIVISITPRQLRYRNFDPSSEAACRTAIDFILNECLTAMVSLLNISLKTFYMNFGKSQKGYNRDVPKADDCRPKGQPLGYTARCLSPTKLPLEQLHSSPRVSLSGGRVDHDIRRVLKSRAKNASKQLKRRFLSLLLVF
jgi:hypothetical protein